MRRHVVTAALCLFFLTASAQGQTLYVTGPLFVPDQFKACPPGSIKFSESPITIMGRTGSISQCAHAGTLGQDPAFSSLSDEVKAVRTDVIGKLDGIGKSGAVEQALRDEVHGLEQRVKALEATIALLQQEHH